MTRTLSEIAVLMGASLSGPDAEVTGWVTDHREVRPGDLFVAIRGAKADGHDFAEEAVRAGAVGVLAERPVAVPYLLVDSVVDALARFALAVREGFQGPVVAITGSAGKTTTKELVALALETLGPVLKSEGNRNTEITAPLLWAELEPGHRAVVAEMGMRGRGQIRHLCAFTKPTVALVTNVGVSHLELLGSREAIAEAKGEILEGLAPEGVAVLNADDDFFEFLAARSPGQVVGFGAHPDADVRVVDTRIKSWHQMDVDLAVFGERVTVRLPVAGSVFALNAAAAVAVAVVCGVDCRDAADRLVRLTLPTLRMEVTHRQGTTVVFDAYNASPSATLALLDLVETLVPEGHRYAVLGEMKELGSVSEAEHRRVARRAAEVGLSGVVFFGDTAGCLLDEYGQAQGSGDASIAKSIEDVRTFLDGLGEGDTVIVKGSRGLALERALEVPIS